MRDLAISLNFIDFASFLVSESVYSDDFQDFRERYQVLLDFPIKISGFTRVYEGFWVAFSSEYIVLCMNYIGF